MTEPLSTHLPEVAGEITYVTGEAVIETGLRQPIQACVASFAVNDFIADQEGKISCHPLASDPTKIVIRVEKVGTNDGVLGDNKVLISWIAIGT